MKIPINDIIPTIEPVRIEVDQEALQDLAQNIDRLGLIEPIVVRPHNGAYEVVCGNRRFAACQMLEWSEIEAHVKDIDDIDTFLLALSENFVRDDMQPMETAVAFEKGRLLVSDNQTSYVNNEAGRVYKNHGIRELSRRTGIKVDKIAYYLNLLKCSPEVQQAVKEEKLTPLHVQWVGLSDNQELKDKALLKAAEEKLTAEKTKKLGRKLSFASDEKEVQSILEVPFVREASQWEYEIHKEVEQHLVEEKRRRRIREERAVARYLEAIREFSHELRLAIEAAEYGSFAPEAAKFTEGWHDSIKKDLSKLEKVWRS